MTLGATLLLALAMAVSFGDVFAGLHGQLFPAGSWRFPDDSTLLKLYPDAFRAVAGASAAAVRVLQAVAVRLALRP